MNSLEIRSRTTADLESDVRAAFDELEVPTEMQTMVFLMLLPLKKESNIHHSYYKHSLRDGLMGMEAAKILGLDQRDMLIAGSLHDIGKIDVAADILGKHPWTEKEKLQVHIHVSSGYTKIRDMFPDPAEIMLYHHRFQLHPYPETMPPSSTAYSPQNDGSNLNRSRELLAIIDTYDALHRPYHDGHMNPRPYTDREIRDKMMTLHRNRKLTVLYLYEKGIFGNGKSENR